MSNQLGSTNSTRNLFTFPEAIVKHMSSKENIVVSISDLKSSLCMHIHLHKIRMNPILSFITELLGFIFTSMD